MLTLADESARASSRSGPRGTGQTGIRQGDRRGTTLLPALYGQPRSSLPVIHEERKWRRPDVLANGSQPNFKVVASRWNGADQSEQTSEITGDYHTISITLQPSRLSFWLGRTAFMQKTIAPGTVQITGPAQRARAVFHGPYDVLHLHVRNALLQECLAWSGGGRPAGEVNLHDPRFSYDPIVERLGAALLSVGDIEGAFGWLYADALSLALIARLLARNADCPGTTARRKVSALPKWRLRRAIDFIEAHADEQVALADLAQAAGLSRMYFAAQFREAMGLRPHEYLLQRRIEKARAMLQASDLPIVQVALSVGFSSQTHFTTVFKRFTGLTPYRYRQCNHD